MQVKYEFWVKILNLIVWFINFVSHLWLNRKWKLQNNIITLGELFFPKVIFYLQCQHWKILRENVHYDWAKLKLRGTWWKIEFLHIWSIVSLWYGKKRGGIFSFKYYFKIRIITIFPSLCRKQREFTFSSLVTRP